MAHPNQIHRCAQWINQLTLNERALLAKYLEDEQEGLSGVLAKPNPEPPDKQTGATIEIPADYWETAE